MGSNLRQFRVEQIRYQTARPFLEKYHYSHNCNGVRGRYCFGLFRPQGNFFDIPELVGAAIIGAPSMNKQAQKWWPLNPTKCLELRRLACIDDTPKNTESFFISRMIKWLQQNTDYEAVLSYADPMQGHQGTIYKASNFLLIGETAPDRMLQIDGKNYHSRTLTNPKPYSRKIRAKIKEKNKSIKVVKTLPKLIYLYPL